jgi:hypothetical protein
VTRDGAGMAAYGVALGVHIVAAGLGFGTIALSGVYAARCRHVRTAEDQSEVERFFRSPHRVGRTLWAVPVAGGCALWIHDGAGALGQAWAVAAGGVWAVAILLAVSVIWPAERRLRPILTAAGRACLPFPAASPGSEPAGLCLRIERAAAVGDVAFVLALGLMIFQPGR